MSLPTKQDLDQLRKAKTQIAISAYLPLDNESPDAIQANQIRIKNLIQDIKEVLEEHEDKLQHSADQLLSPLSKMVDNPKQLWQRQIKSLAVFVSESELKYFFLPVSRAERILQIQESFYLDPLVADTEANHSFYVLSASHNHVQLYKADRHHIEPVQVPDLPTEGMEKALAIDEYPDAHQFHGESPRSTQSSGRTGSSQHHGHYSPRNVDKKLMKEYFRKVDTAIRNYLQDSNAKLLFAGVDYLFPLYRSVNHYQQLGPKPIEGNHEHATHQELHQRALALA